MRPASAITAVRLSFQFLLMLVLLQTGCGLFDTRDPEQPDQGGLDYIPATVPSIALSNLVSAIAQKNVDNYMRNFGDPAVTGAVEAAFKAKYGLLQRVMSALRVREPSVLRLLPRSF